MSQKLKGEFNDQIEKIACDNEALR